MSACLYAELVREVTTITYLGNSGIWKINPVFGHHTSKQSVFVFEKVANDLDKIWIKNSLSLKSTTWFKPYLSQSSS